MMLTLPGLPTCTRTQRGRTETGSRHSANPPKRHRAAELVAQRARGDAGTKKPRSPGERLHRAGHQTKRRSGASRLWRLAQKVANPPIQYAHNAGDACTKKPRSAGKRAGPRSHEGRHSTITDVDFSFLSWVDQVLWGQGSKFDSTTPARSLSAEIIHHLWGRGFSASPRGRLLHDIRVGISSRQTNNPW